MSRFGAVKAWLGGIGFALGVAGMAIPLRPLVWAAVAMLAAAFLFRLFEPRPSAEP